MILCVRWMYVWKNSSGLRAVYVSCYAPVFVLLCISCVLFYVMWNGTELYLCAPIDYVGCKGFDEYLGGWYIESLICNRTGFVCMGWERSWRSRFWERDMADDQFHSNVSIIALFFPWWMVGETGSHVLYGLISMVEIEMSYGLIKRRNLTRYVQFSVI